MCNLYDNINNFVAQYSKGNSYLNTLSFLQKGFKMRQIWKLRYFRLCSQDDIGYIYNADKWQFGYKIVVAF